MTTQKPNDASAATNSHATECDVGEELLVWMITSERPDFHFLPDIEKVRHVRDWLLRRLPVAPDPYYDLPFMRVLLLNLRRERGVYCGGTGYLFAKILNLLGFQATAVFYGIPNSYDNHIMTAVRIHHNGKPLLSLEDAYTGLEFYEGCQPADLCDVTIALRDNKQKNGVGDGVAAGGIFYRISLLSGEKIRLNMPPQDLTEFQSFMVDNMEKGIAKYGYEESIFPYLLLPISLGAENGALYKELMAFYRQELKANL